MPKKIQKYAELERQRNRLEVPEASDKVSGKFVELKYGSGNRGKEPGFEEVFGPVKKKIVGSY